MTDDLLERRLTAIEEDVAHLKREQIIETRLGRLEQLLTAIAAHLGVRGHENREQS